LSDFNAIHPRLVFTPELEHNSSINYLDVSIFKTHTAVNIAVYRKPTFSDAIIPYSSNHPTAHKYAAVRFMFHRLNSFQLQDKEYRQEADTIQSILHNNSFPPTQHQPKPQHPPPRPQPPLKTRSGPPSLTLAPKPTTLQSCSNTPI
jgi:hypothetical protein